MVAHVNKQSRKMKASKSNPAERTGEVSCYRCGGKHDAAKCRFKEYDCRYCHKKGYLAAVCRKKAKDQASQQANRVDTSLSSDDEYQLYTVRSRSTKPLIVNLELDGISTSMEVDTGASVSIVSEDHFKKL